MVIGRTISDEVFDTLLQKLEREIKPDLKIDFNNSLILRIVSSLDTIMRTPKFFDIKKK